MVPDDYINGLKEEIVKLQTMLEPLEAGKMHIQSQRGPEPMTDTTQAWIDHLRTTIKIYQTIVKSRDVDRS